MTKIVTILLTLLFAGSPAARSTPPPSPAAPSIALKAADLQTDVAILRRAYETLHPGLYRYSSKSQMDAKFADLAKMLNHDQSLEQAYLAFSLFAAEVKCGHTYANFFNQPRSVADALFKTQTRVPFYFEWIDRHMVVTVDLTSNHVLPRGTEIVEISGTRTPDVLSRLLPIARADGSNDSKRIASLGVRGDSLFETFDIYFPLFFPQKTTSFSLLIQRPGSRQKTLVEVAALTYDQRIAPIKQLEQERKGGTEAQFEWRFLGDGSAYLRMPTWALYDSKWDWKTWLNAHLDDLSDKKSPGLIIDLRGNEGGQDVGNVILPRLISASLTLSSLRRFVRYREVPADLAPYLDTWDPSFKNWGAAATELAQPWPTAPPVKYLLLKRYDDDAEGDRIEPSGKHFAGKVFVLVDANNSSATFTFAQIIQEHKLGTLVGQPTGGSQRGINGGAFFFLRLPKSLIELDLPLIATFAQEQMPDKGLSPNVFVAPSKRDIADRNDPVMATVTTLMHTRAATAPAK